MSEPLDQHHRPSFAESSIEPGPSALSAAYDPQQEIQNSSSANSPTDGEFVSSTERLLAHLQAFFGLATNAAFPEASVEDLLSALQSPTWARRVAAARRLGKAAAPEAIQPLLLVLTSDPEEAVQAAAARALGEMQAVSAQKALVKALHSPKGDVRIAAAQGLGMLGAALQEEGALALFARFFCEEEENVRAAIAAAISKPGLHLPLDVLSAAVLDDAWIVREAAATTLGRQGELADQRLLLILLEDESLTVCQAAHQALAALVRAEEELFAVSYGAERELQTLPDPVQGVEARGVPMKHPMSAPLLAVSQQGAFHSTTGCEQARVWGDEESIRLAPRDAHSSLFVMCQVCDELWVPGMLLAALRRGKFLSAGSERSVRHQARGEYLHALLSSTHLVVDATCLSPSSWFVRDSLPGSPERDALKHLVESGVIVPLLPAGISALQHQSWPKRDEEHCTAWGGILWETPVQRPGLVWEGDTQQHRVQQQLACSFQRMLVAACAGDAEQCLRNLGLTGNAQQGSAFARRLEELCAASTQYLQTAQTLPLVRSWLYEQFVTSTRASWQTREISRPFAGALKLLIDLAYHSSLADQFACHLMTPADSPARRVLQDWSGVQQHVPIISASDLCALLRQETFQRVCGNREREGLKSTGALGLWDILALRHSDEWLEYMAHLRCLLDQPLRFQELAPGVVSHYLALMDQVTRQVTERNLRVGGRLTAPWKPAVAVTLTVGGQATMFLCSGEGRYQTTRAALQVAEMREKIQVDPASGSAICCLCLTIRDEQRNVRSAGLSTRFEFLLGRLEHAREQWEEVIGLLGETLNARTYAGAPERATTLNQKALSLEKTCLPTMH